MLATAALGFLNHLLEGEDWARRRLQRFAGQAVRLSCGPLEIHAEITEEGLLLAVPGEAVPAVTLTLPGDTPWRLLSEGRAVFAAASVSGSAELAESLAFVLRNLRWDVEDDLAQVLGDIPARRLVQGGRALVEWQARAVKNLAQNITEYVVEENPLVVDRRECDAFAKASELLARDVEQLEKRLAALEASR